MADKFYGVWFPGKGWFKIFRTIDQKNVVWSTIEYGFARQKARELGGCIKRTDLALSEPDAEAQMLSAENSAKVRVTLWQKILKLIRRSPAVILTS